MSEMDSIHISSMLAFRQIKPGMLRTERSIATSTNICNTDYSELQSNTQRNSRFDNGGNTHTHIWGIVSYQFHPEKRRITLKRPILFLGLFFRRSFVSLASCAVSPIAHAFQTVCQARDNRGDMKKENIQTCSINLFVTRWGCATSNSIRFDNKFLGTAPILQLRRVKDIWLYISRLHQEKVEVIHPIVNALLLGWSEINLKRFSRWWQLIEVNKSNEENMTIPR